MNKFLIYFGGVQGSGKGTISEIVKEKHGDVATFHTSKLLLDYLGASSLDNFDKLSQAECNLIRTSLYKSSLFELNNIFGLVDSHYVKIVNNGELRVCIDLEAAERMDLFLHLVSEPDLILGRINILEGVEKVRRIKKYSSFDKDLLLGIKRIQEISFSTGKTLADKLGKPFVKIENNSLPEEVAEKVYEAMYLNLIRN